MSAAATVMRSVKSWLRDIKPPSMVGWMLLSAVLFLAGAAHASMVGATALAKLGVLGAIAAVAMIAAFSR